MCKNLPMMTIWNSAALGSPYAPPRRFAVAVALLMLIGFAGTAASGFELEARYWSTDLGGTVDLGSLDFLDPGFGTVNLGFDAEDDFEGRLTFGLFFGFYVRAAYQNISAAGDGFSISISPASSCQYRWMSPAASISITLGWRSAGDLRPRARKCGSALSSK